jgi:SAM-dependent methyltransferase
MSTGLGSGGADEGNEGPHATTEGPPNLFGEEIAAHYDSGDDEDTEMFSPSVVRATVDFLVGLAWGGDALELGIGTGRIALPLSERGIVVRGIDLSPEMVARLKAKPGGDGIDVAIGDFTTTKFDRRFSLAYLVYNTIENLTTQDAQVACFCNVAEHLEPTGCFVIEVEVPQLQRLPPGETFRPFSVTPTHVGFDEIDVAAQRMTSYHYFVGRDKVELVSMPFRYVWPAELDLMARIAGMTLRERWSDWSREPFTSDSVSHVSVWQKTQAT